VTAGTLTFYIKDLLRRVERAGTSGNLPGGAQKIRIQGREDGISIDQIVLSPDIYLTTRQRGEERHNHTQ
jgi:hypothetical protein